MTKKIIFVLITILLSFSVMPVKVSAEGIAEEKSEYIHYPLLKSN